MKQNMKAVITMLDTWAKGQWLWTNNSHLPTYSAAPPSQPPLRCPPTHTHTHTRFSYTHFSPPHTSFISPPYYGRFGWFQVQAALL